MNYLAHSYLSCNSEELLIGNLVTDLIAKKDELHYSEAIRDGINLHRKIDDYTDNHRLVRKSLDLIRPSQGKYAPVVLDILWDYFLCKNWSVYSSEDLQDFSNGVYKILQKNYDSIQEKVVIRFTSMISHNFLMSCASKQALKHTFGHLNKRVRFVANFEEAAEIVTTYEKELNSNFTLFFSEMLAYVESICEC